MNWDNSSDNGVRKTRPALADLTNQHSKRAFSALSGSSAIKSADGYGKNVDEKEGDSKFAKQICLGAENLVIEKSRPKCAVSGSEKSLSLLKGKPSSDSNVACCQVDSQQENITSVYSNKPNEIKKLSSLSSGSLPLGRGDTVVQSILEVGDASRDSCVSSGAVSSQEEAGIVTSSGTHSDVVREASATNNVCKNSGKDLGIANLASNECKSNECSRLAKSHSFKFFELERCTGLKGDGSSSSSEGADLLKTCSCSFCLKAAYILSDLHYQDIKGRIAALKKSQKDASNLVQRNCKDNEAKTHGHVNSNKSSKLESDLMGQWRSLFLHMEDVFVHEGNQLQASYHSLKELRDSCKMNLEMINAMPLDKP